MSGLLLLSTLVTTWIFDRAAIADPITTEIVSAQLDFDQRTGKPVLALKLSAAVKHRFAEFTQSNVGRKMELRVDGRSLTTTVIREPILGSSVQMSGGDFTAEKIKELIERIEAGKAKVEFQIVND